MKSIAILLYSLRLLLIAGLVSLLASCGFFGGLQPSGPRDGPPSTRLDPAKITDAVPREEPRSRAGNHSPYTVLGKRYTVMPSADGYVQRGDASWYGKKFHGRLTSNGERYNMYAMTAAHKRLPLPTYVEVKNLRNGKTVVVRVNDRGPFHGGRIIDLSYAAAVKLDIVGSGTAPVEVRAIDPARWRASQQAPGRVAVQAEPPAKPESSAVNVAPSTGKQLVAASSQASQHGKRLYLQAGAFGNLAAAQQLQNQLLGALKYADQAYNVVIHPTAAEQPLYRVRIGPLPGEQYARNLGASDRLGKFGNMYPVWD